MIIEGLLKPRVHLEKGVSFCLPERKISPSCLVTDTSFASKKDLPIAVGGLFSKQGGRLRPPFKKCKGGGTIAKAFPILFFCRVGESHTWREGNLSLRSFYASLWGSKKGVGKLCSISGGCVRRPVCSSLSPPPYTTRGFSNGGKEASKEAISFPPPSLFFWGGGRGARYVSRSLSPAWDLTPGGGGDGDGRAKKEG